MIPVLCRPFVHAFLPRFRDSLYETFLSYSDLEFRGMPSFQVCAFISRHALTHVVFHTLTCAFGLHSLHCILVSCFLSAFSLQGQRNNYQQRPIQSLLEFVYLRVLGREGTDAAIKQIALEFTRREKIRHTEVR